MTLAEQIARAGAELSAAAAGTDANELTTLAEELATANRIVACGCGRELLMMRALAMRLYHLGLDIHMQGDMSCPPLGSGDLLLAASGPGQLSTISALIAQARDAGARVACVTAQPQGADPQAAHVTLTISAQTMADDQAEEQALLPMGSVFEGAMFLVFEILVLTLRDRLGESAETMRARHTNLE